jgi:hypothetical protein
MGRVIHVARGHYREADRQNTQVDQLRALVTRKDEIIAAWDETILHREDQINESDHIITQRNTIIEFLQEQIHDLILAADDTQAQLEELQQPPILPVAPAVPEAEEEDRRRLKESQNLILSMEIPFLVPTILLLVVSLL